jgi:hypothetical protein
MKKIRNEILIAIAGVFSYAICLINDFHTDDWVVLYTFSDGFSWTDFLSMENLGRFRPLTNILLYFRYLAFGENAAWYYALNIVLHVAVCILLYRFLIKTKLPEKVSFLAAFLFAIYFQHYEATLWLYGTIRIFVAAFWIMSLWALYNYVIDKSRRSLLIFALVSTLGLFVVEDFVVAPLGFAVFVMLFADKGRLRKDLISVAAIGLTGLLIYFVLRATLIARPQIVEDYYYFGPHIISRLGAYFQWMALPPPDHPYFQIISSRLGPAICNIWAGVSIALMFGLIAYSAYLIFRAPALISFFAFYIFLALLPALPLDYKVTSRNVYLPSIGLCVIMSFLITRVLERLRQQGISRFLFIGGIAVFSLISIMSIWVTSLQYRKNQTLVTAMIADVRASHVDLSKCKYIFLDHMPGRTVLGPTMIYRLGYLNDIVASNDPVAGPIDVKEALREMHPPRGTYAVFDYRNGHLVEITDEYSN